nr:hypothetical protein [Pseudomonas oleovorans]
MGVKNCHLSANSGHNDVIVPTLRVGMQPSTLRVHLWGVARSIATQSATGLLPHWSMGAIVIQENATSDRSAAATLDDRLGMLLLKSSIYKPFNGRH